MTVYELTLQTAYMDNGRERFKAKTLELFFPSGPDEITMRQWTNFQLKKLEQPDHVQGLELLDAKGRENAMSLWTGDQWAGFFFSAAELLACVVNVPSAELLRAMPPLADGKVSLLALYVSLAGMIDGYQPKDRDRFDWKGKTYIWPASVVEGFGQVWHGGELTTAQAIEALQTEHVYNAKDKDGVFILADRKYHTDIRLVALLSRRLQPDGEIEQLPLDSNLRTAHVDRRVKEFEDLPMSVALDMAFFLRASKIALALTRISLMRLDNTQKT